MKFQFNHFSDNRSSIIVYILIGVFFITNLIIACNQSIWLDETYTLNTTYQDPGGVINSALQMEMQPPFYFLLLKFWRLIDDGIVWARMLSVIFASISIFYFYKLIRLHGTERLAVNLTMLFALNPFTFWAAQEIRVYALSFLLLIIQEYLFSKIYLSDQESGRKNRFLFILVSAIGISTNFYLAFPLVANFGVLLFLRRKRVWAYLSDMILPVVCAAAFMAIMPWKEILYYQMTDHSHLGDTYNQSFIKLLIHNIVMLIKKANLFVSGWERYALPVIGEHNYHIYIAALVYIAVIVRLITDRRRIFSKDNLVYVLFFSFLTLILLLQYFVVRGDAMVINHSYYLFPPMMAILMALIFHKSDIISGKLFVILVCAYVARDITYYSTNRKSEGLVQISEYINCNGAETDKIVAYKSLTAHTYHLIDGERGEIYTFPEPFDFKNPINQRRYVVNSKETIDSFLVRNNLRDTIWLITDHTEGLFLGMDFRYDLVNEYFAGNHVVLSDSLFANEYRLQKIRLR